MPSHGTIEAGRPATPLHERAHNVQFFDDDAFLLDQLTRFIVPALQAGQAALVLATPEHRSALGERLNSAGPDVARPIAQGRYVALDAADTLARCLGEHGPDGERFVEVIGGLIDEVAAVTQPRGRVAVFGELVALLCADGDYAGAIRVERLWNDLARRHAFDLLCAYPMNRFGGEEAAEPFAAICAAHTGVIPAESYTAVTDTEERLRTISLLQRKAEALEREIEMRKEMQAALERREAELRAAVAARDQFLSIAAHELKTPITSLRAFAQLLLRYARWGRTIPPERLEAALETFEVQTEKLSHLVTQLLDAAQIDAGRLRINPVEADLAAIVQAALSQQRRVARQQIVYDGPESIRAVVDPLRLEQVVTNVLGNAIKFSPPGGAVTVGLERADGHIRLSVTDEGEGIPPAERERVFGRFAQGRGNGHLAGMGIGLYLSREIVELHGGSMRIEDPGHRGCRVVIALPAPASGA